VLLVALRRLRRVGENNLLLKLFALALATLLYFAVRPSVSAHQRTPPHAAARSAPTVASTSPVR